MEPDKRKWICSQLGSREHYAIPRTLHREGLLSALLTDFWSYRAGRLKAWPLKGLRKLAERSHPDLSSARVEDLGLGRLQFDARARRSGWSSWETMLRRNEWFQERMLRRLKGRTMADLREQPPGIFFGYSYASRHLLRFFRELGWTTILGQIDPAKPEEEIVAEEVSRHPEIETSWQRAPRHYWDLWREELDLADLVAVNSPWSAHSLEACGVSRASIRVLPLAYEGASGAMAGKNYPAKFDERRPLRVLFLGQLNLRKGLSLLFEVIRVLQSEPVEFWLVGPTDVRLPRGLAEFPSVKSTGPVPRSVAGRFYREADLFLLPTLSDGFALTQLEAQAHRLPVIASRFCGQVVEDGKNGRIVDPLTPERLATILRSFLKDPACLSAMSRRSRVADAFTLDALRRNLINLARELPVAARSNAQAP